MGGLRALAWLACVGACAGLTKPPPQAAKQDGIDAKKTAREAAAEMIKSRLATQTTRPVFEQGFAGPRRRLQDSSELCGVLVPVAVDECPANPILATCDVVACGELCEGDGECGIIDLNNCPGGYDVYRKYCGTVTLAPTVTPKLTAVPTPAPTADPSPRPTFAPTVTAAPTTTCLEDGFDGTTLDPQWMYPAGGDGECLLSGTGTLICRNAIDGAHIRTARSFEAPLKISGSLDKTQDCLDHYIKVSTLSSDSGEPWSNRPGFVTFVWDCDSRYIYGQTSSVSTPCSTEQMYDIEITIDDSTVTFRDTAGTCDDLSLTEDIGVSGPLYAYVGADADAGAGDAIWHSVEICLIPWVVTAVPSPRPTFAPTVTPAPTVSPLVADDDSIREAVDLWFSDRAAAISTYGHISTWKTGEVTDMSTLFCSNYCNYYSNLAAYDFNDDISAWDTSNVITMHEMFKYASAFNQPIGDWRVDQVADMSFMFDMASSFNQPLSGWRIDKVTNLGVMFKNALAFDQALGWCVRNDAHTTRAFDGAPCEAFSCGIVQGTCPDPEATAGDYCKLGDPKLCSGSSVSFVEAPSNPFTTEYRYSVPKLADVDGDGKNDLLIGRENGTVAFYRHVDSAYQLAVDGEDPFKSVAVHGHATPALVDLNGDGNLDLVIGAHCGGLAFYKNTGIATAPVFTKVSVPFDLEPVSAAECPASDDALQDLPRCDISACGELCEGDGECGTSDSLDNCGNQDCEGFWDDSFTWISSACDVYRKRCDARPGPFAGIDLSATYTAPAFADIDGDGLVDLVIGKETAGALTYYKNVGSRTTAKFQTVDDGPFLNVIVGKFSKPTFYDIDNDGDQDLIVGDGVGDVLLFLNVGSRFAPSFSIVDDTFAGITPVYAAPTFGMLNGISSLVVGSAPGQIVVYRDTPKLEFVTLKFSLFDGIGVGPFNKPCFVDIDDDGLVDLVVEDNSGGLSYYRNVGTPSQPNFEKVEWESPFYGVRGSKPVLADLDGDGDLDLVVGGGDGFKYYRNVGTPSQPTFEKVDEESPFDGINLGSFSATTFADLDDDGDLDLVVGHDYGKLHYYPNVGTPSQPKFEKVGCKDDLTTTGSNGRSCRYYFRWPENCGEHDDDDFTASEQCCECGGGITTEESQLDGIDVGKRSTPTFADLDNDGDLDLVVGEHFGKLHYYRNVGTSSQPSFEKVGCKDDLTTDDRFGSDCSVYDNFSVACGDYDDDDFTASEQCCACGGGSGGSTIEESPFDGIDIGDASAPAFVDIDNDGDLDLVVGDNEGRLSYFENANSCRKSPEAGACAGHGVCGAFKGGKATCECLFTFEGAQCDACRAGNYGTDCVNCPSSTWSKPGVGETCEECEVGFYRATNSTCVSCGEDKVCETTDVTRENFECQAGTYRVDDACKPCKDGMICDAPGVTIENVRLEKQYWRTSAESAKIETCPLVKSCRSTKPDADGDGVARRLDAAEPSNTTDAGEALCTKGHEGPLCAVCKKHYYRLGLECVKCRRSTLIFTVIGLIVGIIIFGAFFILAMNYSNVVGQVTKEMVSEAHDSNKDELDTIGDTFGRQGSVRYSRTNSAGALGTGADLDHSTVSREMSGGAEDMIERTMNKHVSWWAKAKQRLRKAAATDALRRNVTTFVKQVTGTYSIFTSLPWIFDIKFPNLYEKVLERLAIINVDMSFSLECVSARRVTYQDRLLAATIGPVAAILLVLALGVLYLRFKQHKDEEREVRRRTTTLVIAQLVLLIMFLSYTSTSTTIFRAFRPCDRFDENYHGSHTYMHDDYSVSCKSNRYVFIVVYAALMVLVYPIGIPLASFVVMWRNREKLDPKLESRFLLRGNAFEKVGESDSAFRRARVDQKTELRTKAIEPEGGALFSFAELYHFMYDNYEPQYWWFECFDYLRRLALTGLMVIVLPGSALQGFIGVLIALGGLLSYNTFQPFVEDASDHLAMAAQLSTFFVFLSALVIQVDVVYHRRGFGALLTVVTFAPPFISLCGAFHSFYGAMKDAPEPESSKAAKESAADPESSPTSPLARGAPPQEDEEAPPAMN